MSGANESIMDGHETLLVECAYSPPEDYHLLLDADPRADYFHTAHWTSCVQDHHPDLSAFWLTARLAGRLVGALAGVRTSKPVVRLESNLEGTSGGPLLHSALSEDASQRVFNELMDAYLGLRGSSLGKTCVTFNHDQEQKFGARLRDSLVDWQFYETPAAVIPLSQGLEFIEMKLLKKNKRNERNRALRRDARIEITNDPALLAQYYPIYEEASRRWNLSPAPLSFLQALLTDPHTLESGMTRTFFTCVMHAEQVIGGHLNLQYRDRVVAWNGVTDPNFSKTHFPATLAVWGDIEESCRRGAQFLDLGGSGGVVSLESFKSNFGAVSESRGHYVLDSMGMKILRGGRNLLNGLRGASADTSPRRWHDSDDNGDGRS